MSKKSSAKKSSVIFRDRSYGKKELAEIRKTVHESNLRAAGYSETEISEATRSEDYSQDQFS